MKCRSCSTQMVLDKQESGNGSSTQWHSCPLCGKVRLTSQPNSQLAQHYEHHSDSHSGLLNIHTDTSLSGNAVQLKKGQTFIA